MQPPKRLRDLLWAPVLVHTGPQLEDKELGEVLMPALSPFLVPRHADDAVRLGHATSLGSGGERRGCPLSDRNCCWWTARNFRWAPLSFASDGAIHPIQCRPRSVSRPPRRRNGHLLTPSCSAGCRPSSGTKGRLRRLGKLLHLRPLAPRCVPQIVLLLQVEPHARLRPECIRQPQRHRRCKRCPSVQQRLSVDRATRSFFAATPT